MSSGLGFILMIQDDTRYKIQDARYKMQDAKMSRSCEKRRKNVIKEYEMVGKSAYGVQIMRRKNVDNITGSEYNKDIKQFVS